MSVPVAPEAWPVEITDLTFGYPDAERPTLERVSLSLDAGTRLALLGPNGAGKTTLLLHLNGVLEPTTGRVTIGDLELRPESLSQVRERVGLVFQDPDDQLFMPTLLEDVAFAPLCRGLSPEAAESRARAALTTVGLGQIDSSRAAHHLSGGEKRLAALATALSMEPGVLAVDEPSSGLDARGRRRVAELLARLPQTLIVVTHDVEFALAVCTRAILLDEGRMVYDGGARELLDRPETLREHGLELPGSLLGDTHLGAASLT